MSETRTGPPPSGYMVYWRFISKKPCAWKFGYVTEAKAGLYRMGLNHGDSLRGPVVDGDEIEWREYRG